jgi:hypothetical protein
VAVRRSRGVDPSRPVGSGSREKSKPGKRPASELAIRAGSTEARRTDVARGVAWRSPGPFATATFRARSEGVSKPAVATLARATSSSGSPCRTAPAERSLRGQAGKKHQAIPAVGMRAAERAAGSGSMRNDPHRPDAECTMRTREGTGKTESSGGSHRPHTVFTAPTHSRGAGAGSRELGRGPRAWDVGEPFSRPKGWSARLGAHPPAPKRQRGVLAHARCPARIGVARSPRRARARRGGRASRCSSPAVATSARVQACAAHTAVSFYVVGAAPRRNSPR